MQINHDNIKCVCWTITTFGSGIALKVYYVEFNLVLITSVYIHPSASAKDAFCELYRATGKLQNAHPGGLFIVAGDLLHQYVDYAMREANALGMVV